MLTGPYVAARAAAELARVGDPMTLRRRQGTTAAFKDAAVHGVLRSFEPEEMTGGIRQGDAEITIAHLPLEKAAWPTPPRNADLIIDSGRTWALQGALPKRFGGVVVAWVLWVRGG